MTNSRVSAGTHAGEAMLALSVDLTKDVCAFLEEQTGKRPKHQELLVMSFLEAFREAYADVVEELAQALEIAVERVNPQ